MVQLYMRQWQQILQRTVAKDFMDFLGGYGFIIVDRDCKKDVNVALRSVQRFLTRIRYKRETMKGMNHYNLRTENVLKWDQYLQFITAVNPDPARRVVRMEQSYIHKNYERHETSLFDTNDEQDLEFKSICKAVYKGRRYSFIAAVIDKDRFPLEVADQERPANANTHLLHKTYEVF